MELLNPMFEKILLSLAIGALIGIEREWRAKDGSKIFAGVRTFMLVCLIGVLTSYLSQLVENALPVFIGLGAIAGVTMISYYMNFKKFRIIGLTTAIAFFLTYLIGVLLFYESSPYFMSVSLGIILTLILFSRESLHGFAHSLTKKELRDAVIFAALIFIVLPMLPNEPVDPYGAVNLYLVWLSMVVVMSVSFVGYVAMKVFGERRGLGVAGFFGGLASSTSITLTMSDQAKKNNRVTSAAIFAILVACSTMFFRVLVVASFFNQSFAFSLLPVLFTLGGTGYLLSFAAWRKVERSDAKVSFSSPISFKPILKFMLIFIAIMFASRIASAYFPSAIYVIAALSGIFDVDAITISLASLSNGTQIGTAVSGILIAAIANTTSKMVLARWTGGKKAGKEIFDAFLPLVAAGVLVLAAELFFI